MTIPACAGEGICVVMSVEGEAWIKSVEDGVWQEMRNTDVLQEGDQVRAYGSNAVKLAFGPNAQNTVWVKGQFDVIKSGGRLTEVELKGGRAVAVLDRLGTGGGFKMSTPTSVAAVRGTVFEMQMRGPGTEVLAYEGMVEVWGKERSGGLLPKSVHIKPGQKTVVKNHGSLPQVPVAMSDSEWGSMARMLGTILPDRKPLSRDLPKDAYDYSKDSHDDLDIELKSTKGKILY